MSTTAYSAKQASAYDETRFSSPGGRIIHKAEFRVLCRALQGDGRDAKILEVGCGTGRFILELKGKGYQVQGVDLSAEMLSELEQKASKMDYYIDLQNAEAANLPYANDEFDFVYSIRLLNQTESEDYAVACVVEMARVLKPGGHLLIEFVNAMRPQVGRNRTKTTRLKSSDIVAAGKRGDVRKIWTRGVFFFGMGAVSKRSKVVGTVISTVDRVFSAIFPRLCSRVYVFFEK